MEYNLRTEVGACQEKVVAAEDRPAGALGLELGKVAEVCVLASVQGCCDGVGNA